MRDPTYDPQTMTVAADDGEPVSIFDQDLCPSCGGHLIHWLGGDGPDMAFCWHALGSAATCDFGAIREREAVGEEAIGGNP